MVCAHSCGRKITILFCSIALGIPFRLSDRFFNHGFISQQSAKDQYRSFPSKLQYHRLQTPVYIKAENLFGIVTSD